MFRVICGACGNPAEIGETCKCGNMIPERSPSPIEGSYVKSVTPGGGTTCRFIPEYKARALFRTYSKDCFCTSGD